MFASFVLTLALTQASSTGVGDQWEDHWTVEQVLPHPGPPYAGAHYVEQITPAPGASAYAGGFLLKRDFYDSGGGQRSAATFSLGPGTGLITVEVPTDAHFKSRLTALLQGPSGPRLLTGRFGQSNQMLLMEPVAGPSITPIPAPSLAGYGAFQPLTARAAGDLDGDGYEDAFLTYGHQGSDLLFMRLDGRTLLPIWRVGESGFLHGGDVKTYGLETQPDWNRDGTADYAYFVNHPGGPYVNATSLVVRSGVDGSELMRTTYPSRSSASQARYLPDLNADGAQEIAAMINGVYWWDDHLALLDGATGDVLWTQSGAALAAQLDPTAVVESFVQSLPSLIIRPRTGVLELQVGYRLGVLGLAPKAGIARLNPATGEALGASTLPKRLDAWDPSGPGLTLGSTFYPYPIGDVDGDGTEEFVTSVDAEEWPVPPSWGVARTFAFLGWRTLRCPPRSRVGEDIHVHAGVPVAGGRNCRLVLATQWEPGGLVLDHWLTGIPEADPLAAASAVWPGAVTTLDAQGRGSWTIRFPPGMAGRTIHMRGIVREAGGGVRTLTTPAKVQLLP